MQRNTKQIRIRFISNLFFCLYIAFIALTPPSAFADPGTTTPRSQYQKPPLTIARTCDILLRAAKTVVETVAVTPIRKDPMVDITPTDSSFEIRERPFQPGEDIKFRPDLIPTDPIVVVDPVTGGALFRIVNVIEGRFGGLRLVIQKDPDGPWQDYRKPDFNNLKEDDADLVFDLRNRIFMLGEIAASLFGYRYVDANTVVLPDAVELQGATEYFNSRSPEEIRLLTTHFTTDETFFDGAEFIRRYGDSFGAPFAKKARQMLHDLSVHALQNFLTDPNFSKSLQNKINVWPLFEAFLKTKPELPPKLIANIMGEIDRNIDQVGMIEGSVIPFTMQKVAYSYIEGIPVDRRKAYENENVLGHQYNFNDYRRAKIELDRSANLSVGFVLSARSDSYPAQSLGLRGYLVNLYSQSGLFSYRKEDEAKKKALKAVYARIVDEFIAAHPELLDSTGAYSNNFQQEIDSLRYRVRTARSRSAWMSALSAHPFTRVGAARINHAQQLVGRSPWP